MVWEINELHEVYESKIRFFDKLDENDIKYDYVDYFSDLNVAVIKGCCERLEEIRELLNIRLEDIICDYEYSLILIKNMNNYGG